MKGIPKGFKDEISKRFPTTPTLGAKPALIGLGLAATKGSAMGIAKKAKGMAQSGKIVDGTALQSNTNFAAQAAKAREKRYNRQADKKLKGFKYGVGVGP